jgi:predicted patatin/cPLA2 family phospholipase
MYNKQLDFVAKEELKGNTLVIRPPHKLSIGHLSHNPDEMREVYRIGRETGEQYLERIKQFSIHN